MGGADVVAQRVAAGALQHIDLPRLGVGARGRAAGHLQQFGQKLPIYRLRRESAGRHARGNGRVHNRLSHITKSPKKRPTSGVRPNNNLMQ